MHIHVWVCPLKGTRFQLQDNYVLFGWAVSTFLFLPFFSGRTTGYVGSQFPDKGWEPLQWKCRLSTTGLFREVLKKYVLDAGPGTNNPASDLTNLLRG